MNQAFLFEIELYPSRLRKNQIIEHKLCRERVISTGSQETRARRRLLDAIHKKGMCARSIRLLDNQNA